MKILVVEDDVRLAQALAQILKEAGYGVDAVHDGEQGFAWAVVGGYDVIVLDVMLPVRDGFSVASELRREGVSTPILLLTARGAVPDKIAGYDSGADDYMTKPFSPAELLAHLRALTRRKGEVVFERLSFADLQLDLTSGDLSCGGKSLHLSANEFALMRLFMESPRCGIAKDAIIERVWGGVAAVSENNAEAYVSFLRKKLRFLGSRARIETLTRIGYRLVDAREEAPGADSPCGEGGSAC